MKPIENIFGFDCATCEHNRHCYGGNMGNQFRYCQKSAEKIQNLDNLEKQNKQLKDDLNMLKDDFNKLKEYIKETKLKEFEKSCGKRYGKTFTQAEIIVCNMILDKMQEIEQGSDEQLIIEKK